MERMLRKKKDNSEYEIDRELTGKFAIEKNYEYQERIAKLEEEIENHKQNIMQDELEIIPKLEEENKKLNIKVASLEGEIKGLNYTIDKLKEENQTLELWLDNKEKLNEEYRKQIDKLRTDNIYEEGLYD